MTFKPLTDDLGEAVLMSFLEAFPARTSVWLGNTLGLTDKKAPCGSTWRESSVRFDLNSFSWKMHQHLFAEDLPESSVTLPKWGMMRDGVLWERIMSPLPTNGKECGLWPTPRVGGEENLDTVVERKGWKAGIKHNLLAAVQHREIFPTPRARDWKDTGTVPPSRVNDPGKDTLGQRIARKLPGGKLNPAWVEWLMNWPIGWTDLNASVTDKLAQWPHSHGKS